MTCGVYLLRDPTNGIVRYVGRAFDVKRRMKQHYGERTNFGFSLSYWLDELWLQGMRPVVEVVPTTRDSVYAVEAFLIWLYKETSFNVHTHSVWR